MNRLASVLFAALVAFGALCAAAPAQALDVPGHGGQWVVDNARLLSPADKNALGAELRRYAQASGNQIVVLTVQSLEGEDMAAYANRVARAWGVGQKDANSGVLIVVARKEARVRFEVGRGLEDRLPDILCKRIQREVTVPHFRAGRFGQGLMDTVLAMQEALGAWTEGPVAQGNATAAEPGAAPAEDSGGIPLPVTAILVVMVLLMGLAVLKQRTITHPEFGARYREGGEGGSFLLGLLFGLLSHIPTRGPYDRGGPGGFSGGGGGFGGGSDGGFSGGGGDFGGGGSDSGFGGGGDSGGGDGGGGDS